MRDNGCDMGLEGFELTGKIVVHHIEPITPEDIQNRDPKIFDMNNLVSVSHDTHNAIHYGSDLHVLSVTERTPGDTCPWKRR